MELRAIYICLIIYARDQDLVISQREPGARGGPGSGDQSAKPVESHYCWVQSLDFRGRNLLSQVIPGGFPKDVGGNDGLATASSPFLVYICVYIHI